MFDADEALEKARELWKQPKPSTDNMKLLNKHPCCHNYKDKTYCADCGSKIRLVHKNHCERCDGEGKYEEGMGYGKSFVSCEKCCGTGLIQFCECGGKMIVLKNDTVVCQECVKTKRLKRKL